MYHVYYKPLVFFALTFSGLLYVGYRLVRRARRSRVGTQPHCGKCNYVLVGIASEQCPECGGAIGSKNRVHGELCCSRRWLACGLGAWVLAALFLHLTIRDARHIISVTNWYRFRSTQAVMQDLRTGSGRPPPNVITPVTGVMVSHGWPREEIDLARVALDELRYREKAGKLPEECRQEIADLGLAVQQSWPNLAPVQYDLHDYVTDRVTAGDLSPEQKATFCAPAFDARIVVRPVVLEGEAVPVRLEMKRRWAFAWPWCVDFTYESVEVDGRAVTMSPRPCYPLNLSASAPDNRKIACPTLGHHVLTVTVPLKIHRANPSVRMLGTVVHSTTVRLSAPFEVVSPSPQSAVRLIDDPALGAKLQAHMQPSDFQYNIWQPGKIFGDVAFGPVPVNLAFNVSARYGGNEYPLGHFTTLAGTFQGGGRCDSDLKSVLPKPPPTIDLVLRSSPEAARETLDIFEIWNGEIVLRDVPIKDVGTK